MGVGIIKKPESIMKLDSTMGSADNVGGANIESEETKLKNRMSSLSYRMKIDSAAVP